MLVKPTATHSRVVIWERNPAHPDGEAFVIADEREYEVGDTAAIQAKIALGELRVVSGNEAIEDTASLPVDTPDEPQAPRKRGRPRKFIGEVSEDE